MSALPIRELIERKLDELSEEQLSNLLDYIEMMEPASEEDDYDESRDVMLGQFTDKSDTDRDALVGFISGPTDVAQHTEDILWAEFGLRKSDDKQ